GYNTEDMGDLQSSRIITNQYLDARLGYERSITLSKRWGAFYGLDAVFGMDNYESESSFDNGGMPTSQKESESVLEYGGGPVLGIRFRISDRISIFTETFVYGMMIDTDYNATFSNPGMPVVERNESAMN